MYRFFIKRFGDIVLSLVLLILLSPLLLLITLIILVYLGRPVLFTQERPGRYEKIFKIYKYRTMLNSTDNNGNLLPDIQRITKPGVFLRKTSLDELPELFNVILGDMSLVGPRPLLVKYLPYYSKIENKRHKVRPGITGLAQINGRNYLDWDKRLEMDVFYVENYSFCMDLKILFKTAISVIKREGTGLQVLADLDIIRNEARNEFIIK